MHLTRTLPSLCLALGLAACSSNKAPENAQPAAQPAEPAAQPAQPAQPAVPAADAEKVVNLYTWADYFTAEVLEQFTKDTGIRVQVDTYDSNEALQGKLNAGATGYDVIIPSDYAITIMAKSGLIVPLEHSKLPNLVNIEDQFRDPAFDPGLKHSVPFQWGTSGIGYLADKVTTPPDSWAAIFKPDPAHKGRIALLKDMREVFGASLKYQGRSVNSQDEAEIEAARKVVEEAMPAVKTFNSDNYKELLSQGEVWLSHGWSSNFAMVRYGGNANVKYAVPREGAIIWMDNMAIPRGAAHPNNAYIFINYFLDGKPSAAVSQSTFGSSPNKAAKQFIKPEMLNDPALYPPPEVMQRLEYISDVGQATRIYDRAWTRLRAQ